MGTETLTADGVFNLRTELLKQGLTTDTRAKTDRLTVTIKAYANGGENLFHAHSAEDHAFVVLSGEATFHLETDENVKVLGQYEGIMLPKDKSYKFQSTGEGNLIMLRVGARYPELTSVGKDKSFIPERIPIPGMFFPDDCP
jgi:mannose-6-phosphate isomerase-like protein (cupin superfamily)